MTRALQLHAEGNGTHEKKQVAVLAENDNL
jgi:hypothetical protein